jgi:hypothetical protein
MSDDERAWACWRCKANNAPNVAKCEACNAERKDEPVKLAAPPCAECGAVSRDVRAFHDDGHEHDRGKPLCAACWVPALARRAALDPISPDQRAALLADVQRLRAHFPSTREGGGRARRAAEGGAPFEGRPIEGGGA